MRAESGSRVRSLPFSPPPSLGRVHVFPGLSAGVVQTRPRAGSPRGHARSCTDAGIGVTDHKGVAPGVLTAGFPPDLPDASQDPRSSQSLSLACSFKPSAPGSTVATSGRRTLAAPGCSPAPPVPRRPVPSTPGAHRGPRRWPVSVSAQPVLSTQSFAGNRWSLGNLP